MIVVRFFAVTKPASICNHNKFRNHENDSLQITRQSFIGGVDFTSLFEYPYFFGGQKFGGEFGYRQRLGGLSAVHNSHVADRSGLVNLSPRVITYLLCTL